MTDLPEVDDLVLGNPWEQRRTAISCGLDPDSVTPRSARRRTGDAGLGRLVVVPVYLVRSATVGRGPSVVGLLVRLSPHGVVALDPTQLSSDLADQSRLWLAVHRASGEAQALVRRDGWVRLAVDLHRGAPAPAVHLVLRDSDWALLCSAVSLRHGTPSALQDAPLERVLSRFLGRLDGLDGTASGGLWGRLALEVVSLRHPERLADSRSLRWNASWGLGGFAAGSEGRADGCAGSQMLLDLKQQRVDVLGLIFRVRTLPDWEREQAAHDLGLSRRRLLAWPVAPLSAVLTLFDDIVPALLTGGRPQDAGLPPRSTFGPQDAL